MDPRFITPANAIDHPVAITGKNNLAKIYGDDFFDFLSTLKEYNCRSLRERKVSGTLPCQTISTGVVELFFYICSSLQLPPEVKYLALDLFDRFTAQHYMHLWDHVCEATKDRVVQKRSWLRTSFRAEKQALLRALGCIQIASKFALQSKSVTLKHVQQYLENCGHPYTLRSLYLSEIRVFTTLGCKVPSYSIYDFVTILLEGLQFWTEVEQLYPTSEKVLEYTFLQRDEIYIRYFWMGTHRWDRTRHERLQFAEIELDNFLMASSIVVCSLYIHHLEGLGPNKGSEILSELGNINSNDMRALAVIIAQMILGQRTVTFTSCG